MKARPSVPVLRGLRKAFLGLRRVDDLCELLGVNAARLTGLALQPRYNVFEVPKKSGGTRRIEDPADDLQQAQDALNDYLQAVYWQERSPAAYGFIVNPEGDPSPRHIETNAGRHLNRPWLLNADLKDFFHQVSRRRVEALFRAAPFGFDDELAGLLAGLCTYRDRCPMGAPTSPVLSNLAFAAVDHDLLALAHRRGWVYTRYADDLSFSADRPMSWDDYGDIRRVVGQKHDFEFNPEKAALYGPEDVKIVTGLVLTPDGVEVPPDFIPKLLADIRLLEGSVNVQYRMGWGRHSRANARFLRSIEGKLSFYRRIMGNNHPSVAPVEKALAAALSPPDELEARSWLAFDYF